MRIDFKIEEVNIVRDFSLQYGVLIRLCGTPFSFTGDYIADKHYYQVPALGVSFRVYKNKTQKELNSCTIPEADYYVLEVFTKDITFGIYSYKLDGLLELVDAVLQSPISPIAGFFK